MEKLILSIAILLCCLHPALAQTPAPLSDREFNQNIAGGDASLVKQPGVALEYYKRALKVAQTDGQKAFAQLGIGRATPFHNKGETDPKNENEARKIAFETVLALPEASGSQKNAARLELSAMQLNFGQYEAALANAEAVSGDLNGSQPAQRGDAFLQAGEALVGLKRYDEARKRLNDFLATKTDNPTDAIVVSNTRKTVAHQLIAKSYLAQNNPRLALLEMNKRVATGTKDDEAADIYLSNGDFFRDQKQPALARASYQMVPTLAAPPSPANGIALVRIGASYYDENNYAKAREIWSFVPQMRGAAINHISEALHSTGVAYFQEKNYDKAREAFGQWRDSNVDIGVKVQAWETIASTFIKENNYEKAREALINIGNLGLNLPQDAKEQLNLRQNFGIVQTYRAENNFAQAVATLKQVLTLTPIRQNQPLYFYEAHKQFKANADEMAKEPASMDAAFSLYEAWEAHHPYEFNKGEANMAMGDILVAQGKKDEAKAKYGRVIELRKNYDDAKIAQQKIDKLDGKAN